MANNEEEKHLSLRSYGFVAVMILLLFVASTAIYNESFQSAPQLRWDRRQIEIKVSEDYTEINGTLTATNTGVRPIEIFSVTPSCSCIRVSTNSRLLQPGKSLRLEIKTSGAFSSDFKKSILLNTSAGTDEVYLSVKVTKLAELINRVLIWHVGERPDAKYLTMALNNPEGQVTLTGGSSKMDVSLTNNAFIPSRYTIRMKPFSTVTPDVSDFNLKISIGNSLKIIPLYAIIIK